MWLSKTISKGAADNRAQKGSVTISGSSSVEAQSNANAKSLNTYAPYGYASCAPVGEEVIVMPSRDGEVAIGTKTKEAGLDAGEVMISSLGGASIILKNDGSVIINSLEIDKNGVIHSG
ncbi:MAG: phage baseplate assembly protein [Eubacterium sp.]|nr:phage baseplate assembly protein [Eubacterium sp.]